MTLPRFALAILLTLASAVPALAGEIRLNRSARVDAKGSITIADVCALEGEDAKATGSVVLVPDIAQLAARQKWPEIALDDIRRALDAAGHATSRVNLSGSRCVLRIAREPAPAQEATEPEPRKHEAVRIEGEGFGSTVRQRVAMTIAQGLGEPINDLKFLFDTEHADLLARSAGEARIVVDPVSTSGARHLVRVRLISGVELLADERITVEVLARRMVLVAQRDIRRSDELGASDFQPEERWLDPAIDRLVAPNSGVQGWSAARVIREGDLLTEDDIEPPLLVHRRERVRVLCLSGGIGLEFWARSRDDGKLGEMISLRREGSREDITARVTGRLSAVMDLDSGTRSSGGTAVAGANP